MADEAHLVRLAAHVQATRDSNGAVHVLDRSLQENGSEAGNPKLTVWNGQRN